MKKNNSILKLLLVLLVVMDLVLCGLFAKTMLDNRKLDKNLTSIKKEKKEFEDKYNVDHEKLVEYEEKYSKKKVDNPAVKIPVITFHRTVDHETKISKKDIKDSEWINDASVMEEELKWLFDNGWKSIDLDQFYCWYNKECEFDEKTFVITIDDGDSEAYYTVLPILEKFKYKATLFSIGKFIPETTEPLEEPTRKKLGYDIIKKLREEKSLLQVESHTYDLHSELKNGKGVVSSKTKAQIIEDFKNNEKYEFKYLAYPFGYYDQKLLEVVAQDTDIKMAFIFKKQGYATRLSNKYEIPRIKINSYMNLNDFKKWFDYAK